MGKKIVQEALSLRIARVTKVILGVIIGGVIATTAIAVGARSIDYLERISFPLYDDLTVRISAPASGEFVGLSTPVRIFAASYRGISKVELYLRNDVLPERIATMYGSGPYYTTTLDSSLFTDHSYKTLYAVAHETSGQIKISEYAHVRIDKCSEGANCAKVYTGAQGDQRMRQTVTGLTQGAWYALQFDVKQATANKIRVHVASTDGTTTYANCGLDLQEYSWYPSPECGFVAPSTDVLLVVNAGNEGEEYSTDKFVYIDDVSIHRPQNQDNMVTNPAFTTSDASWQGTGFTTVSVTPVSTIQPFSPSLIYSATSNLPILEDQNIGFWFFKGWPQSHYTWWAKLGAYERPSLYVNTTGAYSYQQGGTDAMKWFSPLVMWVSRESFDTENFNYSNITLTLQTDKGSLNICIPDMDWNSPLINSVGIKGLVVDNHGNTYYAGKYDDPDLLRQDNIAKQCTCSDGTALGTCNAEGTQLCDTQGGLVPADCRVCGCTTPRTTCKENTTGVWSCQREIEIIHDSVPL